MKAVILRSYENCKQTIVGMENAQAVSYTSILNSRHNYWSMTTWGERALVAVIINDVISEIQLSLLVMH